MNAQEQGTSRGTRPRVQVVLQARTTSERLPAKSLLPVGGLPLAVLCAKRLASRDHDVILATSENRTDDALVHHAQQHGVCVFRGSLHNVLDRFLCCTADLADTDIIVRATADNPVPNGELVELLIDDFLNAGVPYLGQGSYEGSVPNGLLVEVFYAGALRQSVRQGSDAQSQEHVTSALVPHGSVQHRGRDRFAVINTEPLRVTIDTLDDYCIAERSFRSVADPVAVNWPIMLDAFRRFRSTSSGER